MNLTAEHLDILEHTAKRAAGRKYCGGSPEMTELVSAGLMRSLGKVAWCPDEYFTITQDGMAAITPHPSTAGAPE